MNLKSKRITGRFVYTDGFAQGDLVLPFDAPHVILSGYGFGRRLDLSWARPKMNKIAKVACERFR